MVPCIAGTKDEINSCFTTKTCPCKTGNIDISLLSQNLRDSFLGETVPPVFRENADGVGTDEAAPFHHLLPADEASRLLGHLITNKIDAVVSGNTETVGPVAGVFP